VFPNSENSHHIVFHFFHSNSHKWDKVRTLPKYPVNNCTIHYSMQSYRMFVKCVCPHYDSKNIYEASNCVTCCCQNIALQCFHSRVMHMPGGPSPRFWTSWASWMVAQHPQHRLARKSVAALPSRWYFSLIFPLMKVPVHNRIGVNAKIPWRRQLRPVDSATFPLT